MSSILFLIFGAVFVLSLLLWMAIYSTLSRPRPIETILLWIVWFYLVAGFIWVFWTLKDMKLL